MRPVLLASVLALAGASADASGVRPPPTRPPPRVTATPIHHVVFIVQENRSFNNLFLNYPGALTQDYGYDTSGNKIALRPVRLDMQADIAHNVAAFLAAYDNGKLDGWNDEVVFGRKPPANLPYSYVPESQVYQYWAMAKQYVLADETFQSNLDGSFVAHQYAIAAFANHTVNLPTWYWGCLGGTLSKVATLNPDRTIGPNIPLCWDVPTIADEADAAGLSWRYYTYPPLADGGIWSAYQNIRHIFKGPDWTSDVVTPASQFFADVAAGQLANITWITPTCENSDHPACAKRTGPAWVTSLVDAVGESKFWPSTSIFIIWDDWGGFFDPVAPSYEDYDGLGFRIPMLVISPYAKKGYVSHMHFETASVLRYIEDNFGLGRLAAADARASDPAYDAFDYAAKPRRFVKLRGGKPPSFWKGEDRTRTGARYEPASDEGD